MTPGNRNTTPEQGDRIRGRGRRSDGLDPNQAYVRRTRSTGLCSSPWPYHHSINVADPTFRVAELVAFREQTAGRGVPRFDLYQSLSSPTRHC